jgi:ubiquinone biosynthesis protein
MRQIFVFGFFHGDPHPGNILILPENVICFLDFGMMGSVSLRDRQNFADFITQIIGRDEHKVTDAVMKLTYHDQDPPRDELERDVAEIIEEHLYRPLKDLETGRLLEQVLNALTKYGLRLKPNLFLMLKSLITIDRLGNMLNPGLELVREAEPFIRTIQMKRLSPVNFLRNMISPTLEFFELIREIPSDFHVLIRQLKEGRLKLEFEHVGLDPLRDSVERVSNRVSFAIVLAALIVGNALITFTRAHEILGETVRYMGMIGFAVAGIVGFWMLLVLIHSRKL